jgi:hypothetical protein
MDLKTQIKKLSKNPLFSRIYGKHRQRRVRSNGKISLEKCQLNALKEYIQLLQSYENEAPNIKELETEQDFYVSIGGKTYLNKEWQKLKELQRELADTQITPSPDWEARHVHYLKSLFKDKDTPTEDDSVNIW